MPISLTNIATGITPGASPLTITVPSGGVPAGSLIVVVVDEQGTGTIGTTPTDTAGNTYHPVLATPLASGTTWVAQVYYAYNCSALVSGNTISYTPHTAGDSIAMSAFYATGILTTDPIDTAVRATSTPGTTGTPGLTCGTPAYSGELIVFSLVGYPSTAWPTGFTQDSTNEAYQNFPTAIGIVADNIGVAGGSYVNPAASAITYAPTITSGDPTALIAIGFQAASVTPPASPLDFVGMPCYPDWIGRR